LHTDEIARLPNSLGGVYVLMAFSPRSPRFVPYYVGQSADIARRLDEHTSSPKQFLFDIHRYLRTYFAVARILHPMVRTAAEAALIRGLKPVGNDSVPDIFPIAVNPPPTDLLPP
jgi:hypothetical protein